MLAGLQVLAIVVVTIPIFLVVLVQKATITTKMIITMVLAMRDRNVIILVRTI